MGRPMGFMIKEGVGFCDIIGKTSVYPKFGHLLDALMGRVSKVMMG